MQGLELSRSKICFAAIEVRPGWRAVGSFGDKLMAIRPYGPYVPKAVTILVEYMKAELKEGFLSMEHVPTGRRRSKGGLGLAKKAAETRVKSDPVWKSAE